MDSGWAVVIGAAIAFAGTVGGTLLNEGVQDRRGRQRKKRDDLVAAVQELIDAAFELQLMQTADPDIFSSQVRRQLSAYSRLSVVLDAKDGEVSHFVLERISGSNEPSEERKARTSELVNGLGYWMRGNFTTDDLLEWGRKKDADRAV
jgi:hypothetical protein